VQTNIGKSIRISDFIDSRDGRGLLLDTTVTSSVGATVGLENFNLTIEKINENVDGIIVNPGQAEQHAALLGGKDRASALVRVDWTNAFRNKEFCIPMSNFKRLMISDAGDALNLGASAVVASFFLGFDDNAEAQNIESLSLLARECYPISLPLVVDIRPIGELVGPHNFDESIKLGVSFMQEMGTDILIIPNCNSDTMAAIGNWISIPVLIRMDEVPAKEKVVEIFNSKMSGIVLSEKILEDNNGLEKIIPLKSIVHPSGNEVIR